MPLMTSAKAQAREKLTPHIGEWKQPPGAARRPVRRLSYKTAQHGARPPPPDGDLGPNHRPAARPHLDQ